GGERACLVHTANSSRGAEGPTRKNLTNRAGRSFERSAIASSREKNWPASRVSHDSAHWRQPGRALSGDGRRHSSRCHHYAAARRAREKRRLQRALSFDRSQSAVYLQLDAPQL